MYEGVHVYMHSMYTCTRRVAKPSLHGPGLKGYTRVAPPRAGRCKGIVRRQVIRFIVCVHAVNEYVTELVYGRIRTERRCARRRIRAWNPYPSPCRRTLTSEACTSPHGWLLPAFSPIGGTRTTQYAGKSA